jgi:CheY-like chemotaxis protein
MPQHFLVIDDDPLLVSCICRYLKAAGHTTSSAGDGVAGEQRARTEHPDLVLLDMRMAGRSGLETLSALRNSAETADIPVVMLSGSDADFDVARREGAAGVLLKPFRQAELLNVVQRALKTRPTPVHAAGDAGPLELMAK